MKKLLCIIASAMALIVASSTVMAEPKKRSASDKATHRMKSPGQNLRHFVNGLPTIQHQGNTRNLNAKVGTKQTRLDAGRNHADCPKKQDRNMSDRCGARFPQLPNYFAATPSSISLQSGPPRRDAAVRDEPNHSKTSGIPLWLCET